MCPPPPHARRVLLRKCRVAPSSRRGDPGASPGGLTLYPTPVLSKKESFLLVSLHNRLRSRVHPPAANMQRMVRSLPAHGAEGGPRRAGRPRCGQAPSTGRAGRAAAPGPRRAGRAWSPLAKTDFSLHPFPLPRRPEDVDGVGSPPPGARRVTKAAQRDGRLVGGRGSPLGGVGGSCAAQPLLQQSIQAPSPGQGGGAGFPALPRGCGVGGVTLGPQ